MLKALIFALPNDSTPLIAFEIIFKWILTRHQLLRKNFLIDLNDKLNSMVDMAISEKLLKYFNRKASKSSDKNHTRYRNDICNHWDLDYLSMEELEERLKDSDIETTITRKKKDD